MPKGNNKKDGKLKDESNTHMAEPDVNNNTSIPIVSDFNTSVDADSGHSDVDSEPVGDSVTTTYEPDIEETPDNRLEVIDSIEAARLAYQALNPTATCIVKDIGGGLCVVDYVN
jgi:hypothetical protein